MIGTQLLIFAGARLHREAWQALLSRQPGINILGLAAELAELAGYAGPLEQATVLVDVLPIRPEFVGRLGKARPDCGSLILVRDYDLAEIVSLLKAGAGGLISRDSSTGDLARAIIAVGRGEIVLPPAFAARALRALARGGVVDEMPAESLSGREMEVLRLLAMGQTNKDIAQGLILSVRTIEAHLRNIYGKLGVSTRTEAALWAVSHGYGPGESDTEN
jgi:DNA-binding NarL/FixJ family response regulator